MNTPDNQGSAAGKQRRDAAHQLLEEMRHRLITEARHILLRTLLTRGRATADDIRMSLTIPKGIDPRCLGGVPRPLAKLRIIESDGYVPSFRPGRHASPNLEWELIDRNAAIHWMRENPIPALDEDEDSYFGQDTKLAQRRLPLGRKGDH